MPARHQPINRVPDPTSTTLHGAWLNKDTRGSGDAASDSGPDGYDMTRVGAPRQEQVGMTFDGASNYLRAAAVDWQGGDTFGVIRCWIKLNTIGVVNRIFSTADEAGDADYWALGITAANVLTIEANIAGTARSVTGNTVLVADQWYFISVMTDGGTWGAYVNAVWQTLTPAGAGNDGTWVGDVDDRDNVCIGALVTNTILEYFDGTIKDLRYDGLTVQVASDVTYDYRLGVPDDNLRLWDDGTGDLSRYARARTLVGGVIVGNTMSLDGVDDRIDYGDIGNIRQISMWVNPGSTTEEIVLVDAGKDIMVNAGTVTYAGLTASATYVNGVASTTLVAGLWQHLICQFTTVDANNFELGTDGANFGDIDVRRLRVHADVWSADEVALVYAREEARV